MSIKIAICEDSNAFRESLCQFIDDTEGYRVVASLPSANDILLELKTNLPDVVLMDIDLPGMDGIEATRVVKSAYPHVNVLMLTVYDDDNQIFDAIIAGATGYLLKKTPPQKILEAITEVYEGGASMNASIVKKVLSYFNNASVNDAVNI